MKLSWLERINKIKYSYDEFMAGLYAKFHYEPLSSRSFVPLKKSKAASITPQDIVIWIADSEKILSKIKNQSFRYYLKQIAKGYTNEEIAIDLSLSSKYVKQFKSKITKILKSMVT